MGKVEITKEFLARRNHYHKGRLLVLDKNSNPPTALSGGLADTKIANSHLTVQSINEKYWVYDRKVRALVADFCRTGSRHLFNFSFVLEYDGLPLYLADEQDDGTLRIRFPALNKIVYLFPAESELAGQLREKTKVLFAAKL